MDFEVTYTPEQEAFRTEVRAWLATNIPEGLEQPVDPGDLSLAQYQKLRELGRRLGAKGWLYPTYPKAYGGGDLSVDFVMILEEELDRYGLHLPPYYDSGGRLGGASIFVWGTEEQKQQFLPPIFRGEWRTWQLLSEPNAGSDLAGVQTRAVRDGDSYIVNGQKIYVGSLHGCEMMWTIVVTDPDKPRHENLGWLMIPYGLPGIEVRPMELLTAGGEGEPLRDSSTRSSSTTSACQPLTWWVGKTTVGELPLRTWNSNTAAVVWCVATVWWTSSWNIASPPNATVRRSAKTPMSVTIWSRPISKVRSSASLACAPTG